MTAQSLPTTSHTQDPQPPIGRALKVAPRTSGGVAYASADQLASLAEHLTGLTEITKQTGWHTPTMVLTYGDTDESIVVGLRWVGDAYYAEIR